MTVASQLALRGVHDVTKQALIAALGIAVILGVLVSLLVPWHMDEFIAFHTLACWQPAQQLNVFTSSCEGYPTQLGPWIYQRSYDYTGIMSSLVMAPFHALWSSPWVTYFVGVAFLIVTALGVIQSLGLSLRLAPIVIVFFPLMFTILHDGGPVRLSLLALAWTPFLAIRFLVGSARIRVLTAVLIVASWLISTEDKPFFLYVIPGAIAFTIAAISANDLAAEARRSWKALAGLLSGAAVACVGLLLVLRVPGSTYLEFLAGVSPDPGLATRLQYAFNGVLLTVDWPFYAHRVVTYSPVLGDPESPGISGLLGRRSAFLPASTSPTAWVAVGLTLLSTAGVIALYALVVRRALRAASAMSRTALLIMFAAGTLWLGAAISGGWATHHFVFAQLPLIGLLVYATGGDARQARRVFAALVVLAGVSLTAIALSPTAPSASREIGRAVDRAVALAGPLTVINCASWGCYYTHSFANEGAVPVVQAGTREMTVSLEELATSQGRDVLHICMDCSRDSVAALYPRSWVDPVMPPSGIWSIFRVRPGP